MPNSQSSQFVVDIVNNEFVYGGKNKFKSNLFSDEIIEILNNNFDYYKNVGQSALFVDVPLSVAYGFIVTNLKNKNVKFIMSVDNNGNKKIIPIDEFNKFFDVKTILRKKKSGSTRVSKLYYDDFKLQLDRKFDGIKYSLFVKDNRLYLELPLDLQKNDCYIDSARLDGKRYFLSKKDNGIYEIKITSSTNNPNIIFELSTKNVDVDSFTIQCLIDYLNSKKE